MNKKTLIGKVAEKANLTHKQTEAALAALTDTIAEALKEDDKVQIIGFGTFSVREYAERDGHSPATGEPVKIPARKVPVFKASKRLKDQF
ncbi:MAG: HU family DNA-binding protein [Clostridia bacterium]|nr:HU family DNA-binding protein [Clostridia bacterium]MBQ8974000.1 HU family DNA-binding protein [Clostridia bacterium]